MEKRIINLGLYRSGSTTLAEASRELNLRAYRQFPDVDAVTLKGMLLDPAKTVLCWWENQGSSEIFVHLEAHDVLCDGWYGLMAFLPLEVLLRVKTAAKAMGLDLIFVCTQREHVDETVLSELHHWVRYDLESRSNLSHSERNNLASCIEKRASEHKARILCLRHDIQCHMLSLNQNYPPRNQWASLLSKVFRGKESEWQESFHRVGKANCNPPLPVEGILLTLRVGSGEDASSKRTSLEKMLAMLEKDPLCNYFVTLGLDNDEIHTAEAEELLSVINAHRSRQTKACVLVANDKFDGDAFPICKVWDKLASAAWQNGADWVVLLGDDIDIMTECHYRCTYRAFLDISERLGCDAFFGCPWWKDTTFAGFPTFPVVGKVHVDVFGSLIPKHRAPCFVNQDLDPYLQRLYLAYGAAPPMEFAILRNRQGGNDDNNARYQRISAHGWKDFVLEDACMIEQSLGVLPRMMVIDIGIPTYRVDVEFLERICKLSVPPNWRSTFIVIVDNPNKILDLKMCGHGLQLNQATRLLEEHLRRSSNGQNNVRVRVNNVNSGASASRNRVIYESSAEYILFLDDDVIPAVDLLFQYDKALAQCLKEGTKANMLGLIGMVRFPRSPTLPMLHAGVLMSYLTFMFEIAACPAYQHPAWGVTANMLVRRKSNIIFDTDYAKTGGGEDVDFCLQLGKHVPEGRFHAVPHAVVEHPFWKGNFGHLAHHFFNWAIGDSGLFLRFPQHTFRSSLNASEMIALTVVWTTLRCYPLLLHGMVADYLRTTAELWVVCLCYILIDVGIELSNRNARRHRIALLGDWPRSIPFLLGAHVLAQIYVIVLEFGRLWGHCKRGHLHCIGLRFDWHCGRLPYHRRNYRRIELQKFSLFLVGMAIYYHGRESST